MQVRRDPADPRYWGACQDTNGMIGSPPERHRDSLARKPLAENPQPI
jgi:hypothetical protein